MSPSTTKYTSRVVDPDLGFEIILDPDPVCTPMSDPGQIHPDLQPCQQYDQNKKCTVFSGFDPGPACNPRSDLGQIPPDPCGYKRTNCCPELRGVEAGPEPGREVAEVRQGS